MAHQDHKRLQLEIGGSFFELIEFSLTRRVRGQSVRGIYGVNVAKVREVVRMPKINTLASRVKGVTGIFELRGIPIPAVNLAVALGDEDTAASQQQQIIVTEFSQKRAGFIVDSTHRIRRVSWDKVLPPSSDSSSCMSGMTLIENSEFLFILDLEKILINLEYGAQNGGMTQPPAQLIHQHVYGQQHVQSPMPRAGIDLGVPAPAAAVQRAAQVDDSNAQGILLVDDSQFIRNGVKQALIRHGFKVYEAGDGEEAYALLERIGIKSNGGGIDMIVTDVEMPKMDGLSFTKKVRANSKYAELPVVLHTSLSGRANQAAGITVGANGYVVKNDFRTLFELIKEILGGEPTAISA